MEYEAQLTGFEMAKESWEMDQGEKIEQAKTCKEKGTQFLKAEKYKLAVKQYKKVTHLLEYDAGKSIVTWRLSVPVRFASRILREERVNDMLKLKVHGSIMKLSMFL